MGCRLVTYVIRVFIVALENLEAEPDRSMTRYHAIPWVLHLMHGTAAVRVDLSDPARPSRVRVIEHINIHPIYEKVTL